MNTVTSKPQTREIVVEEVFPHKREAIWKTITQSDLMARWLPMPSAGFEPVVGNCFTYQTTPGGSWDGVIHCEVLEVVANERFAYTWRGGHEDNGDAYGSKLDTVVTLTLEEADGGTRVRLVHSGFVLPRNETAYRGMNGGWSKVVTTIGAIAGEILV